tara:strand:+ start:117 stop:1007 length:891 start_codon:yes stop_codon:yes gene_type:complete
MRLFLLTLIIPVCFSAQLLDNRGCEVFSGEPFFYTEFIHSNKIKSIKGAVSTKADLQVIKSKGLTTMFLFDSSGKLIKQFDSFYRGKKKDSSIITYSYDENKNITTKRMSDSYGFYSYNYSYNEKGDVVRKTYCRDENATNNKNNFKLKKQYIIVNETYSYARSDSSVQKNVFNNHGSVYQKEYYTYDEHSLLVQMVKKLIVNHKKAETTYKYNDLMKVSEMKIQKDMSKEAFSRFVYEYDPLGGLEVIDEYRNEELKTHKEVIYDKSTFLMKALLVQDVNSNFITITKFTYEFFD